MGRISIATCDRCGCRLEKKGVILKGSIVRLNEASVVLLPAGEYCPNCVAGGVEHECPVGDPPDLRRGSRRGQLASPNLNTAGRTSERGPARFVIGM